MNFAEILILTILYKSIPPQSRLVAKEQAKFWLMFLYLYIHEFPMLVKDIARNIAHPDYVKVNWKIVIIQDEKSLKDIFNDKICYDAISRTIYLSHYIVCFPDRQFSAILTKRLGALEKLSQEHEFRHAQVSKYIMSIFLRKRNFYYIQILNEISSLIQEQIAYAQMPTEPWESSSFYANQAHNKIVQRPHFKRDGIKGIGNCRYEKAFKNAIVYDKYSVNIMITSAVDRFLESCDKWCKDISHIKRHNILLCPDFYRFPVTFNQARRKILTYKIGDKSICLYDSMTPRKRMWFDEIIYSIVDDMVLKSR